MGGGGGSTTLMKHFTILHDETYKRCLQFDFQSFLWCWHVVGSTMNKHHCEAARTCPSFRRRRAEKDLSQETLPTDVVGKILKTLQSAENYFHARGSTNFSATKMAHDCK